MKKHRYERLMLTLAEMARKPLLDESFQVSRLQSLKTLFRNHEAYREFVVMILEEVQTEIENSDYSPLVPLADKIRLFHQVRQAVSYFTNTGTEELKRLNQELYDLQPGWKRLSIHATRRKAVDRHILLLEHAAKSFVEDRADSGFQLVCLYLSNFEGDRFKFTQDTGNKLSRIEAFWRNHPPLFTEPPVRVIRLPSTLPPLPPHLELSLKPLSESEAARTDERTKRGEQSYQPGDWVTHETFGRGLVVKIEETGLIAMIRFECRGTKRIMTTIAPMWPIPKPDSAELEPPEASAIVLKATE